MLVVLLRISKDFSSNLGPETDYYD